ncbi:2-amino-4-hydroxy-6-hydroxymethyldihydropteridine diphosphokinase [Sphingomonas sp. FW199]|uniref:2-amino-4-hydroxy-6- hydroxymethyldihydropteridine diphosphokinase n=1 Tax=Sphingomonas sp. FW199 TaxID=3400217 RepID=UPI003CE7CA25
MVKTSYAVAIGSNRPGRHGGPRAMVAAAIRALGSIDATAPVIETPPIGPSIRRFANTAVLIDTQESPPELLARLKRVEAAFGRRRGQRWAARPIDLDIIWWSAGPWASPGLIVPHPQFRTRDFVLRPLAALIPDARDPLTGLTMRHLLARLG